MKETEPCVLVHGPVWGDAGFYGEWLLAASKAEAFWKKAYLGKEFQKQIDRVCVVYFPDFGIAASVMIMRLREHWTTFVLDLNSEEGDHFTMMAEMGFFEQNGALYRMTLPGALTSEKVKAAIFNFARTEDDEYVLHAEHLITTMPFSHAMALQNRVRAIDDFHDGTRCVGRA
jgi:hypothetical protein